MGVGGRGTPQTHTAVLCDELHTHVCVCTLMCVRACRCRPAGGVRHHGHAHVHGAAQGPRRDHTSVCGRRHRWVAALGVLACCQRSLWRGLALCGAPAAARPHPSQRPRARRRTHWRPGPVDAAYKAIDGLVRVDAELVDYSVNSVTEGIQVRAGLWACGAVCACVRVCVRVCGEVGQAAPHVTHVAAALPASAACQHASRPTCLARSPRGARAHPTPRKRRRWRRRA
jgi:hypothetical protein